MVLSSTLQFLGAALRCIPTDDNTKTTVLMHCGQFIIGIAGGMYPAALISSTWFPPNQRTTSTALSTVAGYIGSALGFIISPAFVDDVKDSNTPKLDNHYQLNSTEISMYKEQINNLLYLEAALQLVILLAIVIYFPAKPKKPPSLSAATGRVDFKNGIKKLFKNYNFLLLATIYGAGTGVYGGWCSVLYQNLSEYGISVNAKFAGWLGFVAVISGSFSGVSFSL
jgi:FLVCR family MFS transporter